MPPRPVRFVVFRYGHHSPHSGYSRLPEYAAPHYAGEVIQIAKPLSRTLIRERMLWRLARGTPGYDRAAMAAELHVAFATLTRPPGIYHFLYGETTYHYAGYLNGFRGNRVVASFHLPLDGFRKAVQIDWHLRRLAAVVCLGRAQRDFFADAVDKERVFYVPLGIDTEFYTPPPSCGDRDPDLCVFVGENYRDFPTLRGVIELMAYRRPSTRFVGVLPRRSHELVGSHPRMTLESGLGENALLGLYRSASVMVMPLRDAVANNALLEAMACGLPVIVTDVGAVGDYVTPQSAVLAPLNDAGAMADAALDLLASSERREDVSGRAREQALRFSWPKVVRELEPAYLRAAAAVDR